MVAKVCTLRVDARHPIRAQPSECGFANNCCEGIRHYTSFEMRSAAAARIRVSHRERLSEESELCNYTAKYSQTIIQLKSMRAPKKKPLEMSSMLASLRLLTAKIAVLGRSAS
jgi:hypothetical protein